MAPVSPGCQNWTPHTSPYLHRLASMLRRARWYVYKMTFVPSIGDKLRQNSAVMLFTKLAVLLSIVTIAASLPTADVKRGEDGVVDPRKISFHALVAYHMLISTQTTVTGSVVSSTPVSLRPAYTPWLMTAD